MRKPFIEYFRKEIKPGFLMVTCGLPSTLKTTVAMKVAGLKGCPVLRTDIIRREIFENEDIFDTGLAGDMAQRERIYEEMFRRAGESVKNNACLILDATFVTKALRRKAAAITAENGKTFIILETVSPREVALRRIRSRTKENFESNALTEESYIDNEKRFESVDVGELKRLFPALRIIHLVVETAEYSPENWYITRREIR